MDRFDVFAVGLVVLYLGIIGLLVGVIWVLAACTTVNVVQGAGRVEETKGIRADVHPTTIKGEHSAKQQPQAEKDNGSSSPRVEAAKE